MQQDALPKPLSRRLRVRCLLPSRREFLVQSAGLAMLTSVGTQVAHSAQADRIPNITGLYSVPVARIEVPRTTDDVVAIVRSWPGKIGIGGGRYSMGGQTAVEGGLHIDMRQMNRVVWIKGKEHIIRVQAGIRWRDLQDLLDPPNLAVKTMQSFSNFTVGGAVSVNCHGRYVGHGPIANTVRALQLVLADGTVVETTRTRHPDIFRAAIGGYGAIGVITEVELEIADNVRIERTVESVPLENYIHHFRNRVQNDETAILHNADLLPPKFDAPISVTWRRVADDRPLTEVARLVPRDQKYTLERNAIWAVSELPGGGKLRSAIIQPHLLAKPVVKWLNHEASLDVRELEPRTRALSTYVLQEYFIPEERALGFVRRMAAVLQSYDVAALNISVRHAPADTVSLMKWAKKDVFCFVLYYKQGTSNRAKKRVEVWTRKLIDLAIQHGGCYYLPYQLHATKQQFESAYPEVTDLRRIKRRVDPNNKFSNELWRKYL